MTVKLADHCKIAIARGGLVSNDNTLKACNSMLQLTFLLYLLHVFCGRFSLLILVGPYTKKFSTEAAMIFVLLLL